MAHRRALEAAAPWILLAAIVLLWEAACRLFDVSEFIVPAPSAILVSLVQYAKPIEIHALHTFWTTLVGFAIGVVVGMILGFIAGSSRLTYNALYPLMVGFNSVPKSAFVPVLVVWFGIGTFPAVATAAMLSFFPITINVATGLSTVDPELHDVLRVLGATRLDMI